MKFTEQIQLSPNEKLSRMCHISKNLYNRANYYVRQEFFYLDQWVRYYDLWFMLKSSDPYQNLPSQTAQQILMQVDRNWKSFFRAMREWRKEPKKFLGRPKPPSYKQKDGENLLVFTNQQCRIRNGYLYFPKKTGLAPIKTRIKEGLCHVRIIPKGIYYMLEIVYEKEETDLGLNKERVVGIDIGLNNIVTLANNTGLPPAIIKGVAVKSINQYYNKLLARYKHKKDKQGIFHETNRLRKITRKRNNLIRDKFHKISRKIIDYCITHDFGTIVIGYNPRWKQKIKLRKSVTQQFVQLPYHFLLGKISYKAQLVGIEVILCEESFTSKCSFLDQEPIGKLDTYCGKRISRGLFRSKEGMVLNADMNAAYNIIRKAIPNALWADGIEGVGFHPYSLEICS